MDIGSWVSPMAGISPIFISHSPRRWPGDETHTSNLPTYLPWKQSQLTQLTRADDLIPEENDVVQKALKRLPPKEAYDRVFRIRRAFQVRPTQPLPLDQPRNQSD